MVIGIILIIDASPRQIKITKFFLTSKPTGNTDIIKTKNKKRRSFRFPGVNAIIM